MRFFLRSTAVLIALLFTAAPLALAQTGPSQPAAAAATSASAPAAPVASPAKPHISFNFVHVDGTYIALTFDDGPDKTLTPELLDLLAKHHIKATFFVLG